MRRRNFLKLSACGACTIALGPGAGRSEPATADITLFIEDVRVELVDGKKIWMVLFQAQPDPQRLRNGRFDEEREEPIQVATAPVLRAVEGQALTVRVRNNTARLHGFEIPGASGSLIAPIPPGGLGEATFAVPQGGSYFYLDPTNAPVHRALGLHGAFIVEPANGLTVEGAPTPYSRASHTPGVARLFNALGDGAPIAAPLSPLPGEPAQNRFPGDPWNAADPARDVLWLFNSIDPRFNRALRRGESIDPAQFIAKYRPRYFTINNLSGFDASNDELTVPKGYVGQPTLIRVLNAAPQNFAPHIHGNHVFELSGANADGSVRLNENVIELDTWRMGPLDRKDILLPFERPPDIPVAAYPPRQEPFPFFYPMHCHMELSQTAGGGMYPQGLITDWEILGPIEEKPPLVV